MSAACLLVSLSAFADSNHGQSGEPLLARLSYHRTWTVSRDDEGPPQICVALFQDGHYEMLRTTAGGKIERLQGTIGTEEIEHVKGLLESPDFRGLKGTGQGLIRSGSESFAAEVPRENGVQYVERMNPDRERPFPEAVTKVVQWLQTFEPKQAEALINTEFPDICPRTGPPVRPIIAGKLTPAINGPSCTTDIFKSDKIPLSSR
ncbi:MAG: hypothetical protein ACRD2U_07680 [Terriglobales bacterium]